MAISLKRLQEALALCKGRRIAVLGDLMLDVYLCGSASRLSPEAPVPVVNVKKSFCKLGGAANVIRNVVALGGEVEAFGVVGVDPAGLKVRELLAEDKVSTRNVVDDPGRRTTEKQRLLAGNQQLVRMDYEDTVFVGRALLDRIAESMIAMVRARAVDAIVFEDYAKGLLQQDMVQRSSTKPARTALSPLWIRIPAARWW
jgi:D-beta-D-heptose 7-phosphate kinase/D-beta-D-heptose 1-phosphate adenosyltransferase